MRFLALIILATLLASCGDSAVSNETEPLACEDRDLASCERVAGCIPLKGSKLNVAERCLEPGLAACRGALTPDVVVTCQLSLTLASRDDNFYVLNQWCPLFHDGHLTEVDSTDPEVASLFTEDEAPWNWPFCIDCQTACANRIAVCGEEGCGDAACTRSLSLEGCLQECNQEPASPTPGSLFLGCLTAHDNCDAIGACVSTLLIE